MFSSSFHHSARSASLHTEKRQCHFVSQEHLGQNEKKVGFFERIGNMVSGLFGKKNAEVVTQKVQNTQDLNEFAKFQTTQRLQKEISKFDPDGNINFAYSGKTSALLDGFRAKLEAQGTAPESSSNLEQGAASDSQFASLVSLDRRLGKLYNAMLTKIRLQQEKDKRGKGRKKKGKKRRNRKERKNKREKTDKRKLTPDQQGRIDLEKMLKNIRNPDAVTVRLFDGNKIEAAYKYNVTKKTAIYTEIADLTNITESERPYRIKEAVDRLMKRVNTTEEEELLSKQIEVEVQKIDGMVMQVIKPNTVVLTCGGEVEKFSVQDIYEDDRPDEIEDRALAMKKRIDAKNKTTKVDDPAKKDLAERVRTISTKSDITKGGKVKLIQPNPDLVILEHHTTNKRVTVQLTDADTKTDTTLAIRLLQARDDLQTLVGGPL